MQDKSSMESEGRGFPLWIILGGVGFGALLCILVVLSLIPPVKDQNPGTSSSQTESETKGESGLANLINQPDLENCRAFLAANASKIVKLQGPDPVIAPFVLNLLNEPQKLEIQQKGPTKLDSHYLEDAFFFREIASRLVGTEDLWSSFCLEKNQKKITRFFTWVCRLVAFQESLPQKGDPQPANPALILKRGWGSGLERSLVFLTLFEQAAGAQNSVPPILISLKPTGQNLSRFLVGVWSSEKKDFWLLDPELGLPLDLVLPGWAWLGPLTRNPDKTPPFIVNQQTWNLDATQFSQARFFLVRPLNALSPRLRATETLLHQNGLTLSLGKDPQAELGETEKALETLGVPKPPSGSRVELWKPGLGMVRDFINPEEGGADEKDLRTAAFQRATVPLDALPPALRIDFQVGAVQQAGFSGPWLINFTLWNAGLKELVPFPVSERVTGLFAGPFISSSFGAGKTKDQMLRGKWAKLTPTLVGEDDDLKKAQTSYELNQIRFDKDLQDWVNKIEKLYAAESRAKRSGNREELSNISKAIDEAWKVSPVYPVVFNALARSRGVEIAYLLAIIRQEEAERLVRGKAPEDRFLAGWMEASSAWKRFNENLGSGMCVVVARTCWAESVFWLGEKDKAIAIFDQPPRTVTAQQKSILAIKADVIRRFGTVK